MSSFADLMTNLVTLENEVKKAAKAARELDEPRVYEWRPSGVPELPAIWNWIDPSTAEVADTAREDDVVLLKATIGVRPSDLAESAGQLVRLMDVFRAVADPVFKANRPLGVREAKRVQTGMSIDVFNDVPVLCMDIHIRCRLTSVFS